MRNPIKWIGKKVADNFLDAAITSGRIMLVLIITSALGWLLLFWRGSPHPRLLTALLSMTASFTVSAVIFLAVAIIKGRGKPSLAERRRVAEILIADKSKIRDLVMVCIVSCRTEIEGGDPHAALTFHLLNMSLYPVSVEGVQGSIRFTETANYLRDRTLLREPITLPGKENFAKHIPFRETRSFTIYQPLTESNIKHLGGQDAQFWLSDLTITIKGEDFDPVTITTGTPYVQKDRDWSASNPESYFIYRDTVRAEAKLRTLEAERDALKELVEKQPQKALPEGSEKK
jgi:hypothetical protein